MWGGGLVKSSYMVTFIVAKKKLKLEFIFPIYGIMCGGMG